jgi:tetratricopeptide (TPR) repeat protein
MNQIELIEFITEISENGVSFAHGKGFEFFRDVLLPNIEKAKKINRKELLADCWYIIGDVYDFNDAPLKAIESYRKAIVFDPNFSSAYREIGNMQEKIGDYSNAIKNIEKAILIEPTDQNLVADLKEAKNSLKNNEKPLYRKDSLNWKLSELLIKISMKL